MTNRNFKLTRAVYESKTTDWYVALTTIDNGIIPYDILNSTLTDNRSPFVNKSFNAIWAFLGIKQKATTAFTGK